MTLDASEELSHEEAILPLRFLNLVTLVTLRTRTATPWRIWRINSDIDRRALYLAPSFSGTPVHNILITD